MDFRMASLKNINCVLCSEGFVPGEMGIVFEREFREVLAFEQELVPDLSVISGLRGRFLLWISMIGVDRDAKARSLVIHLVTKEGTVTAVEGPFNVRGLHDAREFLRHTSFPERDDFRCLAQFFGVAFRPQEGATVGASRGA